MYDLASAGTFLFHHHQEADMANERGFGRALPHILIHEGGKVDHPKDPGGRTNKSITLRVYNAWPAKSNLPAHDVCLIDDREVAVIYRFQYWDSVQVDVLPEGVGCVVFDGAVNSGPKQAIKWLQRALGSLYTGNVDGVMGALTLQAAGAVNNIDALIGRIIERREAFLKALKTWSRFGRGWARRIGQVKATGQAWDTGSVGPQPTLVGGNEKATIEDAKTLPPER